MGSSPIIHPKNGASGQSPEAGFDASLKHARIGRDDKRLEPQDDGHGAFGGFRRPLRGPPQKHREQGVFARIPAGQGTAQGSGAALRRFPASRGGLGSRASQFRGRSARARTGHGGHPVGGAAQRRSRCRYQVHGDLRSPSGNKTRRSRDVEGHEARSRNRRVGRRRHGRVVAQAACRVELGRSTSGRRGSCRSGLRGQDRRRGRRGGRAQGSGLHRRRGRGGERVEHRRDRHVGG